MTNLATIATETAERIPDGIAYKLDDTEVNWQAVDEGSARVAGLLKEKGFEPGDRVGVMLPNVPYFPIAYYGILRAGGTVVPMNVLLKGREVKFYLEDPGAKLVFAWHDFAEAAEKGAEEAGAEVILVKPGEFEKLLGDAEPEREVADRDGDDTAVILYTSGTTGQPKGAELTHDNMHSNAKASHGLFSTDEDDVVLGALPLFHSFGQTCCMNACALSGATLTFIPRFDPDKALEIIERDKVTLFAGVPTMYNAMLNSDAREKHDHSSLRICCSGGSAMPGELMRGFEKAFDTMILEGYGLSETSPVASFNHPDKERKVGSIGTPIEGVEMKLVDDDGNDVEQGEVGEIAIKGHNVMKGYHDNPEATETAIQDGWFRTGDLGRKDDKGFFYIVDRSKDMIIRGGFNVYPREIEETMLTHPAVSLAAVIGVPDDENGEEIKAFVIRNDGDATTEDELVDWCADQMAAYKYPRSVQFVDALPMTATGKILKRELPRG